MFIFSDLFMEKSIFMAMLMSQKSRTQQYELT